MPAITDRLREGFRDARDFVARRFDPRAAVRGETLKRVNVIRKLEALLGGEQRKIFNVAEPIYSGSVWANKPTHIEVSTSSLFGSFGLLVQTGNNPPRSYGLEMKIRGGTVEFFELPRTGNRIPFTLHPKVNPWDTAQKMVDRVTMATSNDSNVRRQYQAMRAEENRRVA